jgi:hypothetical protein
MSWSVPGVSSIDILFLRFHYRVARDAIIVWAKRDISPRRKKTLDAAECNDRRQRI